MTLVLRRKEYITTWRNHKKIVDLGFRNLNQSRSMLLKRKCFNLQNRSYIWTEVKGFHFGPLNLLPKVHLNVSQSLKLYQLNYVNMFYNVDLWLNNFFSLKHDQTFSKRWNGPSKNITTKNIYHIKLIDLQTMYVCLWKYLAHNIEN